MTNQKQNEKFVKMTTAPLEPLIIKLAIPTMISMLVTTLYNLVDTLFVGQLGSDSAQAAVTVSFALMNIIQAMGFFFGQGSGNYISRALGEKEEEKCKKMASTGFFSAILSGILILILGSVFIEPLALLCGSTKDGEALNYAKDYMQVILLGAPVMCGSIVLNNQLRFQGNAIFAMIGLASGAVINVALDAILVPRFQVLGAAIATVICQVISFVVLLVCHRFFSDSLKFSIKDFSLKLFYYKEIFRGGFPSLCRQGIASFMNSSLMHCCQLTATELFPATAIQAAFGIVTRLMMFISSLMIGFGQGFQPVCGFNYGAKKYDRVIKGFCFCVIVTFVFLLVMSVLFWFVGPDVLKLIQKGGESGDNATVQLAVRILKKQLLTVPLMSVVVMSNMMLQTTGNVMGASVLAMARQGLTLIPSMFLLSYFAQLDGLIWAQPVADVVALLLSIPFAFMLLKKMKRATGRMEEDQKQRI